MSRIQIWGPNILEGKLICPGCKNAALPILAASLLSEDPITLQNVPHLLDVENMLNVLQAAGAKTSMKDNVVKIDSSNVTTTDLTVESARKIRSSILIPCALASRLSNVKISYPGGDNIGTRKIDLLISGMESLGVKMNSDQNSMYYSAANLKGCEINFYFPSVSATEGIIITAVKAEGTTTLHNAAKEPEITDLANFLNSMGAKIKGAGSDTIQIKGIENLHGSDYIIMPDRIAAGTYMVAASITKGSMELENTQPEHITSIANKLKECGATIKINKNCIKINAKNKDLRPVDIITEVYPGFPTDMQPLFTALMSTIKGQSTIKETIYDDRFRYVSSLNQMGANIEVKENIAKINGVTKLKGSNVVANDIRAGAALVLAGLVAEGLTEISNISEIDRGYESIEKTLSSLGATIKRII